MDIVWPVPSAYKGSITQQFAGPDPAHDGIDFGVGAGNTTVPCYACADGVVTESLDAFTSYGCRITIDHGRGLKTRYCHLKAGSRLVKVGDTVTAGQRIATVGTTGNSPAGEHLHFMLYNGGGVTNPLPWLQNGKALPGTGGAPTGSPGPTRSPESPYPTRRRSRPAPAAAAPAWATTRSPWTGKEPTPLSPGWSPPHRWTWPPNKWPKSR